MKNHLKLMKSFITLVGVSLLSCMLLPKHTINSVVIHRGSGTEEWLIDNPFLTRDIKILEIKETKEGNLLFINVLIKNTWYRPIHAKIKVEFYDRKGIQIENPWGWHPLILETHQEEWFKFMAPLPEKEIGKIKIMLRGIGQVSM